MKCPECGCLMPIVYNVNFTNAKYECNGHYIYKSHKMVHISLTSVEEAIFRLDGALTLFYSEEEEPL